MPQTGLTNDLGTAYRHSLLVGAFAGALAQLRAHERVEIMLFAGGRAILFATPNEGDPAGQDAVTTVLTPEFGGNITVKLPGGFDLTLGSVVSLFSGDDEDDGGTKVFTLGVGWTPEAGFAPIVDEEGAL